MVPRKRYLVHQYNKMNMIVKKLWMIHKTERLDTYIKYIFLKTKRCRRSLQRTCHKRKRKIFDSRTKRYRIIGHIRYRPKILAIHFQRQYWKLLCRTVPCLRVVRLNESFGSKKLFRQLSTQQWENSFFSLYLFLLSIFKSYVLYW